jgi:glycosyltransferase involved in cell wall biosynthesis
MIVKNEEACLPQCLDSVSGLAGEIVIADTGSTDRTRELASSYGAKIIPVDFSYVDFASARNQALACSEGQWILVLDADEILDPSSLALLSGLMTTSGNTGYFLERHNYSGDNAKPFRDYVVRFFPNRPHYRYRGRVHETIDASILSGGGKLVKTGIRINHSFCQDREVRRRKSRQYIEILKEEIGANPGDNSRLDFLAAEYHQLEMYDEATRVAERIAGVRPRDPRAHLFAGVYHLLYQRDYRRARADFIEALKLHPEYQEAKSFLRVLDEGENRRAELA